MIWRYVHLGLQLTRVSTANVPYPATAINFSYGYSATQNNGKAISQTDNISGEQVQYTYDSLSRLASATATSGSWGQSYNYVGIGNLTAQKVTAGSAPSYSASYDPATDHPLGTGAVDANGNVTICNTQYPGLGYDIENQFIGCSNTSSGAGYQCGLHP